ncbi:hypothetical protein JI721_09350 [Alicyclobacillus cycloheptanicus]|uniref:histidine kinase n=1 Tax=Alicyclobacillus cycloheptanicus TaxID=1457 RepID=A0ABT9XI25_9BACL|nr:ATP-binding protein [Alicyclobacillus cycloheptanicus]MDQ0189679.1 signal transduction histidine kinase [Alicyclobacillus cycloheptanicus]WDL99976.1 hypothetical protein JI721_09350 [Alicyclobacillus cycloheptanicus]
MTPTRIKWTLFIVPALVIGGFETIRHTLLEQALPMELGNWITALIDAFVIALITRRLFQQYVNTEKELGKERESRAVFEERERLVKVLHDQIAQSIFYSGVQLDGAKKLAEQHGDKTLKVKLDDVHLSLREIDENVRQSIFNLKHNTIEAVNFEDRVRSYLNNTLSARQISWDLQFPDALPLTPWEQVQLFGILQESVTNVIKHANASTILVSLDVQETNPAKWTFRVRDNGIGFDLDAVRERRYGLDIIANRARDIGAEILVESDNTGTSVCVRH